MVSRRSSARTAMVVLVASCLGLASAPSGAAAPSDGYGDFTQFGASGAFSGAVALPLGFPATTYTSTSRTSQVNTGATSWIPLGTAFGAAFGSSQGKEYLSLRPNVDSGGRPSVTTYSFATATPAGGWGLVIGDIDAETIMVSGTTPDGSTVRAGVLGVEAFNYCDASPRSSACSGFNEPYVVPTVETQADTVSAFDPLCPGTPERCDTTGVAISVRPSVPWAR